MLTRPMDILLQFPVCRSGIQKKAFRDALQDYAKNLDYTVSILGAQNLVIGDPESAKFLMTARQENVSAVITLLEILRTLPVNQRYKVCFLLFDKEKPGINLYCKTYKETADRQFVLHLDYVAAGDVLRMIPTKQLLGDRRKLTSLYRICGYFGAKSLLVHKKGYVFCAPGIKKFSYGISICTLQKNKLCYTISSAKRKKDKVLDEINVNILRAALTSYICCDS